MPYGIIVQNNPVNKVDPLGLIYSEADWLYDEYQGPSIKQELCWWKCMFGKQHIDESLLEKGTEKGAEWLGFKYVGLFVKQLGRVKLATEAGECIDECREKECTK